MELKGSNAAVLYPDSVLTAGGKRAVASNAIDGKYSVGASGAGGATNCAVTSENTTDQIPKYLRIDLGRGEVIQYIKLRLRDRIESGEERGFESQRGLTISVGVTDNLNKSTMCGNPFDPIRQGQAPYVDCKFNGLIGRFAQYIWIVLTAPRRLEICEVEIFYAGRHDIASS